VGVLRGEETQKTICRERKREGCFKQKRKAESSASTRKEEKENRGRRRA